MPKHMKVLVFTGPSAAGKSTTIKKLSGDFITLPEMYMELNSHNLDNRLVLSKWTYIHHWFNSVLNAHKSNVSLLITDRSPVDTCAYVSEKNMELLQLVRQSINELKLFSIIVKHILVIADFDILQRRINDRLKLDSRRLQYNESNEKHNKRAYDFYKTNMPSWDEVIDTSNLTEKQTLNVFTEVIKKHSNE